MLNTTEILLHWAEQYLRSKDAFFKKIIAINKRESHLEIEYKDKTEYVYALPELKPIQKEHSSLIILNNRKNLDILHDNWKEFIKTKEQKIYFINPLSSSERKWIIAPSIHDRISEPSALKIGLKALFATVDPISEDVLKSKYKKE